MANPIWPSQLPNPLYGANEGDVPGMIIKTGNDAGVAKHRLRYTAVAVPFKCSVELSLEQYAIFKAFVKNTLRYVLPFDWVDMMNDTDPVTYRFTKKYTATRTSYNIVTVDLDLEIMP